MSPDHSPQAPQLGPTPVVEPTPQPGVERSETDELRQLLARVAALERENEALRQAASGKKELEPEAIADSFGTRGGLLEAVMEASGAALWEVDFQQESAFYSPAFHRLLGLPDGTLGTSRAAWRAYALPDDLPAARARFEEHVARGDASPFREQFRMRRADGTPLTVLSRGRIIAWDEHGRPARMAGCYLDISPQAEAEAVARASEENFRTVIENLDTGVFLKDPEGRWLVVNQKGRELLGLEQAFPCVGRTDAELAELLPGLAPLFAACRASDEKVWADGVAVSSEEILPGSTIPQTIVVVKVPLFESDRSRRGLVVIWKNVTQDRLQERQLRERDAQFTALTTHAPGLLYEFRLDPSGQFSLPYISANVRQLYGEEPDAVMRDAQLIFKHILDEDLLPMSETIKRSAETMSTWQLDFRIRHADGSIRWLRGTSTPRWMDDGAIQWSGYQYEITQLKRAESEAIMQGKREVIERLAGGVAHDFNNYLTSIRVSAELLREHAATFPPAAAGLTETLLTEIDAAARIARQLLAFTKDQPLQREVVRLKEFLRATADFALRGSGVTTACECVPVDLSLWTDRTLLQQILLNLLLNAREAMGGRGNVLLEASRTSEGRICLRVSDDGPGIPMERREFVFEPYYTSKSTGSGLGLHVARSLSTRLGAEIELDATSSRGATFWVILPCAPEGSAPLAAAPSVGVETFAKASAVRPHVLLLEDEEVQIQLLARFFRAESLRFETFGTGEALLVGAALHREKGPDEVVCLLDITVQGGLGGLEIAVPLRELLPAARIYLVSGYSDAWETRGASLAALDIGFLSKPYTLADLRQTIFSSPLSAQGAAVRDS